MGSLNLSNHSEVAISGEAHRTPNACGGVARDESVDLAPASSTGSEQVHHSRVLANLVMPRRAGDEQAVRVQCDKAIAICNDPTCDYARAKQDAQALLADTDSPA